MSTITRKYQLNKELPRYPVGSIVYHQFQILPSQFNDRNYATDGEWYSGEMQIHGVPKKSKLMVPPYVGDVIKRAITDHNLVAEDWVTLLEEKEDE